MTESSRSLSPRLSLLQEQRYRRRFLREDGRQTAMALAVTSAAYVAVVFNDFALVESRALVWVSLAARALFALIGVTAIMLLRRARWPREQDRAFLIGHVGVAIAVAGTHLTRIPTGFFAGPLFASAAWAVVIFLAQRGPLSHRALLSGWITVTAIVLVAVPQTALVRPVKIAFVIILVVLHVVGFFSARAFEENRRKRFEAERALTLKMRELAIEKERAESMSRARTAFLAAMSHEFRTPMNAVIGLSDVLLDAPLAPEHRAHVQTISESARALLGLLEDILDFAKIDAQKLTLSRAPFDLRRLAASVADMLRPAATSKSLELALDVSPAVPSHVVGDDARLRQVLVNLLSNAVKFTERGTVTLRVAAREQEIVFRVEDTGIGLSPGAVDRLFRPFEQGDGGVARRYGGTGLGLAISKQIVAAMDSDIQVESEPGRGSVFSFAVRLAAAPVHALSEQPPSRADSAPLSILVVDDQPINREVARAKLAKLGYTAEVVSSGEEAIQTVSAGDYDVVLMDLHMPGMSGIEATARIAEATAKKRAPEVVAMTASVFEEDREACRRAGMRGFVGKPIDVAELDRILRGVAAERGAAAPASAVLSSSVLSRLRQIESLGEPDLVAKLARLFVSEAQKRLPRMKDALARGDGREIASEAHALTSASATIGATGLSELTARVEGAAREGRIDDAGKGLSAIAVEVAAVERALMHAIQGDSS